MIDAYEIGIQFALQDGVTAGLELIKQQLAQVDRAIAASNAGLAALTRSAEGAARAIAAVPGARPAASSTQPTAATPNPSSEGVATRVDRPTDSDPTADRAVAPATPVLSTPPVPERAERTIASAPATEQSSAPSADRSLALLSGSQNKAAGEPAPPSPRGTEPATPSQTPEAPAPAVPRRDLSPVVLASAPNGQLGPETRARPSPVPRRPDPARSPMRAGAVTASVPKPAAPRAVGPETGQYGASAPMMSVNVPVTVSQFVSTAPESPRVQATAAPSHASSFQRPAAPTPEPSNRGDGGSGVVMLDGRLVGYWLAEQMGRDASRPPSGTSFFDPRQTPAWAPSGAI